MLIFIPWQIRQILMDLWLAHNSTVDIELQPHIFTFYTSKMSRQILRLTPTTLLTGETGCLVGVSEAVVWQERQQTEWRMERWKHDEDIQHGHWPDQTLWVSAGHREPQLQDRYFRMSGVWVHVCKNVFFNESPPPNSGHRSRHAAEHGPLCCSWQA